MSYEMTFKYIVNRDSISTECPKFKHHLISIHSPEDSPPILPVCENRLDVLTLSFSDINYIPKEPFYSCLMADVIKEIPLIYFEAPMARKILDFVEALFKDGKMYVIHCDAGISRSPGVAAALNKIYFNEDSYYFKNYSPNSLVYTTILKVYYDEYYRREISKDYDWLFK